MLAWRRSAPRHPSLGPVALSAAEIISTGAVGLPFSAWASSFPHWPCFAWSFREATILTNCRRVEERRLSRVEGVAVADSFRHSWCLSLHLDHVSSPRSSNPAYGFPALGLHVGNRAERYASRCRPPRVLGAVAILCCGCPLDVAARARSRRLQALLRRELPRDGRSGGAATSRGSARSGTLVRGEINGIVGRVVFGKQVSGVTHSSSTAKP